MTDDIRIARPRIVSPDEAKAEDQLEPRRRKANPSDKLSDYVTRREMIDGCANAALAVGQKMFDQMTEETSANLERMEHVITQRVLKLIEQGTVRYRLRAWYFRRREWVLGYLIELGLKSPLAEKPNVRLVDAAEALDPNAHAAADLRAEGLTKLRAILAVASEGDGIELPAGTTVEDMYEIDRELHPEAYEDDTPAESRP